MHRAYTMKLAAMMLATLVFFTSVTIADVNKRHVQLVTPAPFKWDEYGPTNPLNPDGSDYPCKIPQGDEFTINGAATEMAIGEAQQVSFSGWAVHGGGSCQFALTEGFAPTRDSAWKVIHSIEGGCPKANVAGNLDPGQSPDTYTFSVPDDFAPGNYTWAWTWVNRIAGSPEFYMNCAPITVTAAAGSTRRVKERRRQAAAAAAVYGQRATTPSYPDLFLANIGSASSGCDTSEALHEQIAISYPSPGDSVSYPNGQENLFKQPCDGNPRNNGAAASSAGSQPSAAAGSATKGAGTATASAAVTAKTSRSVVVSSAEATSSATLLSSTLALSTPTSSPTADSLVPSSTSSAAASTSTTTLNSPCTDGHLLCVGGTQFSTCTGSAWDAPQNLAANTMCEEQGESVGLNIAYHWS